MKHNAIRRYLGAGVGLAGVSLIAQAAALIRTLQLASQHGAGASLDTFYLATAITVSMFNIIGAAVTMVLVPEFVKGGTKADVKRYIHWTSSAAATLAAILLGGTLAFGGLVFGGDSANSRLGTELVFILLVGQLFRIWTALNTAALQAKESFLWPRILTLVPAFIPVLALLLQPDLRVVCLSLTAAYALEALGNHLAARGVDRLTDESIRDVRSVRKLLGQTWPIIGSSALFQVQVVGLMIVVSRFGEGAVTAYSNAFQLVGFVQIILIQNVLLLIYPRLTALVQAGEAWSRQRFSSMLSLGIALSLGIILMYVAVGRDAVTFLFARGAYSSDQASVVYEYGLMLLLALPFGIVREVFYRVLYARGRSRDAAVNAVVVIGVTLAILVCLVGWMGIYSIFVSLVAASAISAFGAYHLIRRLGFRFDAPAFWISSATYTTALACALICVYFATSHLIPPLRPIAAAVIATGVFSLLVFHRIRKDIAAIGH